MKKLTKKQTLELCKVNKANYNRVKKQLCKCICCQEDEEPIIVYSFYGLIGLTTCSGRCTGMGFTETLFYTTSLTFLFPYNVPAPQEGNIVYYDEALTMPVNDIPEGQFLRVTDCVFANVSSSGLISYVMC